ncbi:Galactoside 2-alpha-L-fucosyltransferase [Linum grandiflorum]
MKFSSFSSVSYTVIPLTLFLALFLFFSRNSNFDLFQTLSNTTAANDSLPTSGSVNQTTDTVQNVTRLIPDSASQGSMNTTAELELGRATQNDSAIDLNSGSKYPIDKGDPLLGGLLFAGFDAMSCQSRYQSHLLRRTPSSHQPSNHLISKLRSYERLHKHCGPGSRMFQKLVKSPDRIDSNTPCKYISWIPVNGLGNMIISLTATFLYALQTDRVLLVEFGPGMDGLFCEPFPNSSWVAPQNFPHRNHEASLPNFETLLKNSNNSSSAASPKFVYLNIERKHDRPFHCDYGQEMLDKVPMLFIRSDQYFVPSLFMVEKFNPELIRMFPEKGTVFHHLGRYLFHPSNQAWGLITRFFDTYLAKADQRIGIQIRVFNSDDVPPETVMDQISACSKKYNILPELSENRTSRPSEESKGGVKAILVASLSSKYADDLRTRYWTAEEGEKVGVFQASHEGVQKFKDEMHNVKAWAEMYMLSLCDELVTSGQSTFGYVAQGLGDVKPWIMQKPLDKNVPNPPCWQGLSVEPCFHWPPEYECSAAAGRRWSDGVRWNLSLSFGYLKPCEDLGSGVKLMA